MAQKYERGFLSRNEIGGKLGLKGLSWYIVQKAMVRVGLVEAGGFRKCVPTQRCTDEGLWLMHCDVSEQGQVREWPVFSPKVVDMIREAVDWVKANPKENPLVGTDREHLIKSKDNKPGAREYPDGYMSLSGMAMKIGCSNADVKRILMDWDRAEMSGKYFVSTGDHQYSRKFTGPSNKAGETATWDIWSPECVEQVREEVARRKAAEEGEA